MGIDWEYLLGAEGDELQDAYDEAVAEWDEPYELDDEEEQELLEARRAKLRLVRFWSEDKEERKAVREALGALFHTKFSWTKFGSGDHPAYLVGTHGTEKLGEDGKIYLENARFQVVMTDGLGRIVLLSKWLSDTVLFDHCQGEASVCDCIANSGLQKYPFRKNKHVSDLRHEYDADGMPVCVYGRYYDTYDDGYYYETIEDEHYNVWCRSDYQEEDLTWIFQRVDDGEKQVLKPVQIWKARSQSSLELVWQSNL